MRIVTWNINSLNIRLPHVLDYLSATRPDVLALQETKLPDDRFPREAIEAAGYRVVYSGQKTYNGMAVISRTEALGPVTDLPELDDHQRRLLAVTVDGVRIVNVYVPNGQEVGSEKYAYKLRWLEALAAWLQGEIARHPRLVLLGDFNIAPADLDVHDPKRWREKIMCSSEERSHFRRLLALGLHDAVRELHPGEPMHSWWDYRLSAFGRGWGLRIDHVLLSQALAADAAGVDAVLRAGERPSDHAPVWVEAS
ncbi:MAG TPA: exodeoxyribonuclease III [Mariprofundaceae bacterium]|nr:exodeoxyribonuclease III [Mariprofundaceae bacterium]